MSKPAAFGSFGRPEPPEIPDPDDDRPAPVPVLHVGEVHAELRLTVTSDTLSDLGSQIASMISAAARQGFEHGMAQAMDELGGGVEPDENPGFVAGSAPIPGMSTADLARAHGELA
jgi:hypothetical protein